MGHASDRTLIASLGFADKDKTSGRHTLACEWAASASGAAAILDAAEVPFYGFRCKDQPVREGVSSRTEVPLTKGERQYATTIGFVDAVLSPWLMQDCGCSVCVGITTKAHNRRRVHGSALYVEVKIAREDVGAIIRQINFYRPHVENGSHGTWVLLADWEINEIEATALRREKIVPLRLGERFRAFCEAGKATASVATL